MYLVVDLSMNVFVIGGQNIFFYIGIIVEVSMFNQFKGVIVYEMVYIVGVYLVCLGDVMVNVVVFVYVFMGLGLLVVLVGEGGVGVVLMVLSQ